MYFPFLRGRQYELIALREMLNKHILSDSVIPMVEPVRLTMSLINTVREFGKAGHRLGLILNPKVGHFPEDLEDAANQENNKLLDAYDRLKNYYPSLIVDQNISKEYSSITGRGFGDLDIVAICNNEDSLPYFAKCLGAHNLRYTFVPDKTAFRRTIKHKRVLLEDHFNRRERNSDYADRKDEMFSLDHLYYRDDGYVGFSDYSIIGDEYSESGFAPRAIAIHIVYFGDGDVLRVRHFVSDTNEDIKDTAGKFGEAVNKLVTWAKKHSVSTYAIDEFRSIYENRRYPGLGTVKKLSIMHHLELMGKYLDQRNSE